LGSVMGGIMGYFIGMSLWSVTSEYFFTYVPGFSQAVFEKVSAIFHEHAFMSVFMAGLTPIPYKVFTIAAGVAELSFAIFVGASVCSRGIRFFAIGGCLKVFGPSVKQLIDKYFNWFSILFFVLLVSGFVVVKKLI
jgi:membrane protein YqaA with SNARE-associated domain